MAEAILRNPAGAQSALADGRKAATAAATSASSAAPAVFTGAGTAVNNGPTSGGVAAEQAYANERGQEIWGAQWNASQMQALINLWNMESGWNPHADNKSSGAYGIPQSLPGDKMASAGADWRTNYKTQINWGLEYIATRYGSPEAAWQHEMSHNPHWY